MRRLMGAGLAVAALAVLGSSTARAGFAPDFLGTSPSGSNTAFNYNLVFTTVAAADRLQSGTTIPPATPGDVGSEDFLTIYDIPGIVSATAGSGFSVSIQFVGINGPATAPADDPTLANVTFHYTGATVTADTTFTGFNIVSSFSGIGVDAYTSQFTDNSGIDINEKIGEVGTTTVPVVPEPASVALTTLGALGCLALFRRRKARA